MASQGNTAPLLDEKPTTRTPEVVREVALTPASSQAVAPASDAIHMFERMASDPNASVEKIERLMALWERGEAKRAEADFNAAMSSAQSEMEAVNADSYNPSTKSKYASYEAIDADIRPVYTKNGFGLSFSTGETQLADYVRVQCKVSHRGGHSERYHIDMPADGKGAKGGDVMTKTHAVGSAVSYGMRYLLKMIFNIAVGDGDDDGNRAGLKGEKPGPPPGYVTWADALEDEAKNGADAYTAAWNGKGSKAEWKTFMANHDKDRWNAIKASANAAGRVRR